MSCFVSIEYLFSHLFVIASDNMFGLKDRKFPFKNKKQLTILQFHIIISKQADI